MFISKGTGCRLFLVSSVRPEEEGSFVLTELGTASELCCLAARATSDELVRMPCPL